MTVVWSSKIRNPLRWTLRHTKRSAEFTLQPLTMGCGFSIRKLLTRRPAQWFLSGTLTTTPAAGERSRR